MRLTDCTPGELDRHIAASRTFVVDLWAEWCPRCRVLTGMLERLAPDFAGRVIFLRLDHGEHPEVGERHGIRSLPSLLLYRDGRLVDTIQGFTPAPALRARLDALDAGGRE